MRSSSLLKHITPFLNRTWYRHASGLAQSELVLHNTPVLPLIDFSAFASKDETNHYPHDIIEKLANACEHVGFFYAIGHG
ncbi:unnamed protein product [Rotaria sordida]|nr:unnamed protein product [Rotaria sordida]